MKIAYEMVNHVCLSYRHDFGLLSSREKAITQDKIRNLLTTAFEGCGEEFPRQVTTDMVRKTILEFRPNYENLAPKDQNYLLSQLRGLLQVALDYHWEHKDPGHAANFNHLQVVGVKKVVPFVPPPQGSAPTPEDKLEAAAKALFELSGSEWDNQPGHIKVKYLGTVSVLKQLLSVD